MSPTAPKRIPGQEPGTDEPPAALVTLLLERIRAERAVPLKGLVEVPLSKTGQGRLFEQLARAGIERTGKHARLTLAAQLEALLASGPVEVRTLKKQLRGVASATEVSRAVSALVDSGRGRRVFAHGQELLVGPAEAVIEGHDRQQLLAAAAALVKLGKAAKGRPLLLREVAAHLGPFASWASGWLRAEIAARVSAERPLVFIPELGRALQDRLPPERLASELLAGAEAGRWELRPESGVGLLSADDARLCPRGWNGEVLSFLRLRER